MSAKRDRDGRTLIESFRLPLKNIELLVERFTSREKKEFWEHTWSTGKTFYTAQDAANDLHTKLCKHHAEMIKTPNNPVSFRDGLRHPGDNAT